MQWGHITNVTFDEEHYEYAVFKKTFPNRCINFLTATEQSEWQPGMRTAYVVGYDNQKAVILPGHTSSVGSSNNGIFWMALGY